MGSAATPEIVSLADLARDPALVDELTPERARALLPQLAVLTVAVTGRVVAEPKGKEPELPQLIGVKELSKILGKSSDFIYQHSIEWPFTVRLGSRDLMFDLGKLNRWLAARTGAK